MINDFIPLFYGVRLLSLILSLGIAGLVLRKRSDYILNKLISASFLLFAFGYTIEAMTFLLGNTIQNNSSYFMAIIVFLVTTAIYLIFLVSYSLMKGEESVTDIKLLFWTYTPFIALWFLALATNSFRYKEVTDNANTYWLFEPNPLGTISVVLPAFIYLLMALYYLMKLYRVSNIEMKPSIRQFTFGVTFAILFGILIVVSSNLLSQTDEIQFLNQSLRPLGVAIGGIFIARSFLKN